MLPYRNIVIRATNWVGDAVMSLPALGAVRTAAPNALIAIVARPWVADLYRSQPFCDELIVDESPRGWRGLSGKLGLARKLSQRKFDAALILPNSFESALVFRMAAVPIRIGYTRDARSLLLTHPVPVPKPGDIPKHQRFYYLELLRRASWISSYDSHSVPHLYRPASSPRDIIGVAPGAAFGGAKRWLPERFAEAAVTAARENGITVEVFGSQSERPIAEQVSSWVQRAGIACTDLAGKTTLSQLLDHLARCRVLLTNDSGAMHLAAALDVPTVAVFGATDDEATGPVGKHTAVVRHPVSCSPCLLRECPIDHRCMTGVTSTEVAAAMHLVSIGHEQQNYVAR